MMHPPLSALVATFVLSAISFSSLANDTYLLKPGHFRCITEQTIIEMADAADVVTLRRVGTDGIRKGQCLISELPVPIKIVHVRQRYSPERAIPYFCYKLADEGDVVLPEVYCSLGKQVTTLAEEMRSRTGGYKIKAESPIRTRAECTEGGSIWIERRDGMLFRSSSVFYPIEPQINVPAGSDMAAAIQLGCKGIDYAE